VRVNSGQGGCSYFGTGTNIDAYLYTHDGWDRLVKVEVVDDIEKGDGSRFCAAVVSGTATTIGAAS
jgi:hypothetical protein